MMSVPTIYAVRMDNCSVQVNLERIERWSALVPVARAMRVARFRHWEDQWRSLSGNMIVNYVLREKYKLPVHQMIFTQNEYGKPILLGNEVQFNVSHSGVWTVAVFHSEAIGIDIEKMVKADLQLAQSMFTSTEYETLINLPEHERDRMFNMIWTAKESYIKALGKGLAIPLNSFSVVKTALNVSNFPIAVGTGLKGSGENDQVFCIQSVVESGELGELESNWKLHQVQLDPDYMLTTCTTSRNCHPLIELDASQLN